MPFIPAQLNNKLIIHLQGKSWRWRLPLLLRFLYVLVRYLVNYGYARLLSPLTIESFICPEEIINYLKSANFKNTYHAKMNFAVVHFYCAEKY
jgi:hypothetical protein